LFFGSPGIKNKSGDESPHSKGKTDGTLMRA
jgi:hypothetical protein